MTVHQRLVAELVAEGCATTGLREFLRDAYSDPIFVWGDAGPIPDAWNATDDNEYVDVYEVEVTNPMTRRKLNQYAALWDDLHGEVEVRLWVVNRFGHRSQVDLERGWLRTLGVDLTGAA